MNQAENQTLSCPDCGRQYPWQARLAGRRVSCKCGSTVQVAAVSPAPPAAGDGYELTEEAPSAPPAPPRVLTYESKEVFKENRRRLLEEWHVKDLWLPISLVVLGIGCKLLLPLAYSTGGGVRAAVVMGMVALCTAFNVLVMLAGVMIAARLVDLDVGAPMQAVVKLGLVFVAGASAGGLIANLDHFDSTGVTVAVYAIILIYWILFSLLFKAGLVETLLTIAIIVIMQGILNLGLWKT